MHGARLLREHALSASQANTYANNATASADQAAQSATIARQAAGNARNDANTSSRQASAAASSAQSAHTVATQAANDAAQARANAISAGQNAKAAARAATEALDIAATKQREEDEANYLSRRTIDTTTGTASADEIAAARATGGQTAVDDLIAARSTLGNGELASYIVSIGGQLLLDLFGVTDIINCVSKGDIGACAMALVGFLPIGKILQAGKAVLLLGKLIPKITEFFTKRQHAIETVEQYAETATRGGVTPVRIGQAGEKAVRAAFPGIGDKARQNIVDPETGATRTRIFDGLNKEAVSEIKNVKTQSYSRQIRDSEIYASEHGLRLDIYVREYTHVSQPLLDAATDLTNPIHIIIFTVPS